MAENMHIFPISEILENFDEVSTFVKVVACCLSVPRHNINHHWALSLTNISLKKQYWNERFDGDLCNITRVSFNTRH